MPDKYDPRPTPMSKLEAQIGRLPDGRRKAELSKQLHSLKHAFAMHAVLEDEIADQIEGKGHD